MLLFFTSCSMWQKTSHPDNNDTQHPFYSLSLAEETQLWLTTACLSCGNNMLQRCMGWTQELAEEPQLVSVGQSVGYAQTAVYRLSQARQGVPLAQRPGCQTCSVQRQGLCTWLLLVPEPALASSHTPVTRNTPSQHADTVPDLEARAHVTQHTVPEATHSCG